MVGAFVSDLLLQVGGVSVFLLPVFMSLFSLRWFRSLKIESPIAKSLGAASLVLFGSALIAMLPWHWRWRNAAPAEGLLGESRATR